MHELMFQAVSRCESLKGMSERSELIPCTIYNNNYYYNNVFLFQLKLYTMHPKVTARIDDSYSAYSHSVWTLKKWHDGNKNVGNIVFASQFVFPILVTIYIFLFLRFVIELKPYSLGATLEHELNSKINRIKSEAQSKLLTGVTISLLIPFLTLVADSVALYNQDNYLSQMVKMYYQHGPWTLKSVPWLMFAFDIITCFIIFVVIPIMTRCTKKKYKLMYCVIGPFSCLATHGYHIVFAFIHDPYHATSILLLYAIVVFVHIQGFQKLFYFINSLKFWGCSKCNNCCKRDGCCHFVTTILFYMIEFIFMAISIGLSLALIIVLPISNAIDEAPNRLYVIYQASVTFFAALIAFKVFFRKNKSILGIFIKAINTLPENKLQPNSANIKMEEVCKEPPSTNWIEMSEKEKELYVAQLFLKQWIPKAILANKKKVDDTTVITDLEDKDADEAGETSEKKEIANKKVNDTTGITEITGQDANEAGETSENKKTIGASGNKSMDKKVANGSEGKKKEDDADTRTKENKTAEVVVVPVQVHE